MDPEARTVMGRICEFHFHHGQMSRGDDLIIRARVVEAWEPTDVYEQEAVRSGRAWFLEMRDGRQHVESHVRLLKVLREWPDRDVEWASPGSHPECDTPRF